LTDVTTPTELAFDALFPFELDAFQQRATSAFDAGKSVVVSVPTGSGKTLVGEYAIYRALVRGKRVFYTTPLKALSNQKLSDFQARFGRHNVGLVTGDVSHNRNAPVLVMTTEVFRNMLYGTPIGQAQGVPASLEGVEAVVLDECHYMNDPSRGTVWEESIIYCPRSIQLLALSATIANADQLTDWIDRIHGSTALVRSDFRPVPLQFHFSTCKGLHPLLDRQQRKIDPRLKAKKRPQGKRRVKKRDCPSTEQVLQQLQEREMLPAIYFIFSRRGCDRAVADLEGLSLVDAEEAQQIEQRVQQFLAQHPEGARAGHVEPLTRGIAAHHAGILPAWKGLVEELFGAGLVKVVFATETLAAGINMPARTTAISSLAKRTDRGHRLLRASEFLQMAGRAGRRGMDATGHVVCVQTRFEGAAEAAQIATQAADPLVSQFSPTYGMALNLLQTQSLQQVKRLLERSFAQYLAEQRLEPERQAIAELTREASQLDLELAQIDPAHFASYDKLRARLKEERRIAKYLQREAEAERTPAIAAALDQAAPGQILYLKGPNVTVPSPLPAVLYTQAHSGGRSAIAICIGNDNRWYVAAPSDVAELGERPLAAELLQGIAPPGDLTLKPGKRRQGDEATAAIAGRLPADASELPAPPAVAAQQDKIARLERQLAEHPLQQWGKPSTLLKRYQRRETVRAELEKRQSRSQQQRAQHWQAFLNLVSVLHELEALQDHQPTELGETAAAIRADNELWLALALRSGALDALEPQQLAAAMGALVLEPPRPDSQTHYAPSRATAAALGQLQPQRDRLLQVQRRHGVSMAVWLESSPIGLVEQWALGEAWGDLCDNTSLDEGDIVRILRRTMDVLAQLPHVPHISPALGANARRAIQLMERFPLEP